LDTIFRQANISHPRETLPDIYLDLGDYCFASALRAVTSFNENIDPDLAFQLLDPASAHYPILESPRLLSTVCDNGSLCPWQIHWHLLDADNSAIAIFLQLMELKCLRLAEVYLHLKGVKGILESQFSVTLKRLSNWSIVESGPWYFQGTFLEYFAVYAFDAAVGVDTKFSFCVERGAGHVDFTSILPAYSALHHSCQCQRGVACLLRRLLHLGALPDPKEYQVTPLQILCHLADARGVNTLLRAGVDPNGIGDMEGTRWGAHSMLREFDALHGFSPLRIARTMCHPSYVLRGGKSEAIEQLLLQYQARDFASRRIRDKEHGSTSRHHSRYNVGGEADAWRTDHGDVMQVYMEIDAETDGGYEF
jgi:hypothetical protein